MKTELDVVTAQTNSATRKELDPSIVIEPEQFLVLFWPRTTSVRSGLGTFFVPGPEHAKHFLCS